MKERSDVDPQLSGMMARAWIEGVHSCKVMTSKFSASRVCRPS